MQSKNSSERIWSHQFQASTEGLEMWIRGDHGTQKNLDPGLLEQEPGMLVRVMLG
jgi:hypothetical protein